jgi:TM2 domain-containing membrane protein YozV
MDDIMLMQDMTDSQRMMFQSQMSAVRKDKTTGILLALFLGGFGAHHFYLGNTGLGIAYILFCWTFIPAIAALVECFLMSGRIDAYNADKAMMIAAQVKMMR